VFEGYRRRRVELGQPTVNKRSPGLAGGIRVDDGHSEDLPHRVTIIDAERRLPQNDASWKT
jgi:hypothetical protein